MYHYTVDTRLPAVFKSEVKCPVDRLSNEMLLQRCLKGLTQNQNAFINNMLWSICSKRTFCVNETRTKFNKGVTMKAVVMKNVGCAQKNNNVLIFQRGKFLINLTVTAKTTKEES